MAKKLSDQEVADALANFRERPKDDQMRSVIWQELAGFPEWASAQYTEGVPAKEVVKATLAPPDPRLPGSQRAAAFRAQGVTDDGKAKKPASGSMTTGSTVGKANPFSDYKAPPPGPCLVAVQSETPPPFEGAWRRVDGGWFRDA